MSESILGKLFSKKEKGKGFFSKLFESEEEKEKKKSDKFEEISKKAKDLEDFYVKKKYLKEELEKTDDSSLKKKIRGLLINAIKSNGGKTTYSLTYDSFSEGLEPVYFWVLDFLTSRPPRGLGFKADKTAEDFEASIGSAFYGEIGGRGTRMQEQAMKMLGSINTVVRSLINILYDLREFEIRLDTYKDANQTGDEDKRRSAEIALKGIWMDQVDIKRGRGSINSMAQQLQFITLRDAFMSLESLEKINKDLDLNARVKRILEWRFQDYLKWKEYSEKELTKRYNIEKAYLRSQVASLEKYAEWTRPYIIIADKLRMKDFNSPGIVSVFNNMLIELGLFATKPVDFQDEVEKGNLPEDFKSSAKYYQCVEIQFNFRSIPHSVKQTPGGTQYTQGGKVEIIFKAYGFSEDELKELKEEKEKENLEMVDAMVGVSMDEIKKEVDYYLGKKEEKKEEKKRAKEVGPFGALFDGLKDIGKDLKGIPKGMGMFREQKESYPEQKLKELAKGSASKACFLVYDIYKKAHGMLSW